MMTAQRLELLIEKHQELDDKVDEMMMRKFLTPREKLDLKNWKILRLRYRDAINLIQKESVNGMGSSEER
jgi:hypothetical protein